VPLLATAPSFLGFGLVWRKDARQTAHHGQRGQRAEQAAAGLGGRERTSERVEAVAVHGRLLTERTTPNGSFLHLTRSRRRTPQQNIPGLRAICGHIGR
jgi:hypothetical protein